MLLAQRGPTLIEMQKTDAYETFARNTAHK
jgi:hypothetical protein